MHRIFIIMILLIVSFFSVRRGIKVLYHQFNDIDFVEKKSGENSWTKEYLVKKTIIGSLLIGFMVSFMLSIIIFSVLIK